MSWLRLKVAPDGSHHMTATGAPAYGERFDEVLAFHAPGLAPASRGGEAWHIHSDGSAAYARRFMRAFGFYEDLAAVVDATGWHHILPDGRDAYPERYAWCGNFQDGRCAVREPGGAYLHVAAGGRPVYAERWRYAGDYRSGAAVVQAADGRSTHINASGGLVHGRWFVDLDVFHKRFARARDEDGWLHVDQAGRPVYARRFAAVEPFYNGQARVERFDGALEVIDESGTPIMELRAFRRSEFAALSEDMVGFWRTQTIAVAVRLGVVESLPATEADLAARCRLRPDRSGRLLRALGELHLVTRPTGKGGRWELTPRGALLRGDHPLTLADAALEYAGPMSDMWSGLADALAAGTGWSAPDVFGDVARDRGRREAHHRMLRSYARHDYSEVPRALDLRGDERIVDAGGGLGALARFVLEAYPSVQVTVLDRPEVIEQARAHAPVHGLDWHPADLFESWRLEADVVLLSRVLHDWDDEGACRILRRARRALSPGGRVIVIEMLLRDAVVAGGLCDLHLLMATGGQERSAEQFKQLFRAADFQLDAARTIGALPSILVGVAL